MRQFFKNIGITILILIIHYSITLANDSTVVKNKTTDSIKYSLLNMDAIYNRPFLADDVKPISFGGYFETNFQSTVVDGVLDKNTFEARRMTLFFSSRISSKIKFLSELEFENGAKEIALEFAALDIELMPLINFRGGMILNPIGAFNQNHDGPKWEFTDRPLASTELLPATWSNPGLGIFGKEYLKDWMIGYEFYFSNGFDNSIIENEEGKTFLPASKENPERFESISSNSPLITTKLAVRNNLLGELGLSYMGGVYNRNKDGVLDIDAARRCNVYCIDYNKNIQSTNTIITGEVVLINVDVPATYSQQFGNTQYGGFIDIIQNILQKNIWGYDKFTVSLALRLEYVDWNVGYFRETGDKIYDETWSIIPALSIRPNPDTVIRLNYRYRQTVDLLGNEPSVLTAFSLGLSSYF